MIDCIHTQSVSKYRRRRQDKYLRRSRQLEKMRETKKRKREQAITDGWTPEPKMEKYYPLEFGVRDKATGETAWTDLKSVRQASRALGLILKYY